MGLAVSDIKAAKYDADLKQQAERARLVLESEVSLPDRIRKIFVRETEIRSKTSNLIMINTAGNETDSSSNARNSIGTRTGLQTFDEEVIEEASNFLKFFLQI